MKVLSFSFLTSLLFLYATPGYGQNSIEDGFDPFADYSEFIEASTEETDINFFKYGRLLSFGLSLGQRSFTGPQTEIYENNLQFGVFVTFYTSINFAFQTGFQTSSHDTNFSIPEEAISFDGTATYNNFFLHGKYFINTQNLTKTVARFNPYFIGGVSQFYRETQTEAQQFISGRDAALSFDGGFGFEYLFNQNKNFLGAQAMYHFVRFPNENKEISLPGSQPGDTIDSGLKAKGDIWHIGITGGFNF